MNYSSLKRKFLNTSALWISYFKLIPDLFRLGRNSLVIDCGANVGYISKFLARTGAQIISFEPNPTAFKFLYKRCKDFKNIKLIQKGVWDKNATIRLFSHKNSKGNEEEYTVSSSIKADKKNIDTEKGEIIEVIDLVDFMKNQTQKIDLIKLDVEGAEIEILNQILATGSWNLFDRMYVETHELKIPSQQSELKKIKTELKLKGIRNIKLNWI
jgi:FkbM family methyltransferase